MTGLLFAIKTFQSFDGDDAEVRPMTPIGEFAKVIITELNPEVYYKTLQITPYTTAFEVIVKIIQKFAKEEDRDPDMFYLTEVRIIAWALGMGVPLGG